MCTSQTKSTYPVANHAHAASGFMLSKSLMAEWLEQAYLKWHGMSSNTGQVKLGVHSASVLRRTWRKKQVLQSLRQSIVGWGGTMREGRLGQEINRFEMGFKKLTCLWSRWPRYGERGGSYTWRVSWGSLKNVCSLPPPCKSYGTLPREARTEYGLPHVFMLDPKGDSKGKKFHLYFTQGGARW